MSSLYHIVEESSWKAALKSGKYRPESLDSEGFIHLSYTHQWRLTQQRYYTGRSGLLLLQLDPDKLSSPLRQEQGFPHLYGPLNCDAVCSATPLVASQDLKVGLLSAIRPSLAQLLAAKELGCQLVFLPELPFQRWCPAFTDPDPQDEDDGRLALQADMARQAGLWLVGGGIEGRRNVAYLWDAEGQVQLRYEKLHLPQEPGFWEANHYEAGQDPPQVCDRLGFPLGLQICSDIQRPFGAMFLRHLGASAILVPRATESRTYPQWRLVMQALARMSASYILSVNRPSPEFGVPLGGPSVVVGPDGEVIEESDQELFVVQLSTQAVIAARSDYPGYLGVPNQVYAQAWLTD